MVVSHRFVWAHIPKTGGDAAAAMLQQIPRLVVLADPAGDNAKHLGFDQRRESIAGKLLVANIRRLPSLALSLARHRERFGSYPEYRPEGRGALAAVASGSTADAMLDAILGPYEVDVWLRQEELADDLIGFLRDVAGTTREEEAAIRAVGPVNRQRPKLRWRWRPADNVFTPAQVATLYANNPRWAAIEKRVYG